MEDLTGMFAYMQEELENLNKELRKKTYEVMDSNGLIKITVNGLQEVRNVNVSPKLINPGSEAIFQEALREALSQVMVKSKQFIKQEMGNLMGGLDLPNIFG